MAYVSSSADDEELKKKQAGAIGGEAEASAAPGEGGGAMAGPQPYTQSGFASAKNIFNKNQGAAESYDVTQPFAEDLNKDKEATAQSFGKLQAAIGQKVQGQKVEDNDLAEAISKGQQAGGWSKVMGALNPQAVTGALDPSQKKYSANDVTSLNTAPGIQSAIANQAEKKGVQNYTQGMGSLDAAIYQRDAGYRNKVAGLSNQYAEADKQRKDYETQAAQAVEKSNKELQDNAAKIRGDLDSRAGQIKTSYAKGGEGYNQQAVAAHNQARQQAEAEKQKAVAATASALPEPQRSQFLQKVANVDANQFVNEGFGNEAYTQDAAGSFNNIMTLLGKGDRVNSGEIGKASVNTGELQKMLDVYANQAKSAAANDASIAKQKAETTKAREAAEAAKQKAAQQLQSKNKGRAADPNEGKRVQNKDGRWGTIQDGMFIAD